jgi:hypothetical protein
VLIAEQQLMNDLHDAKHDNYQKGVREKIFEVPTPGSMYQRT